MAEEKKKSGIWKWLFALVGVGVVVGLVVHAGAEHVLSVLAQTAVFLPVIVGLEALSVSADTFALRSILGSERNLAPPRVWWRSAAVAYALMIFLPAGRAGGEVARASILSKYVGGAHATAAATRLQAATLFANAIICIPCAVAIAMTVGAIHPLMGLLALNALATFVIGTSIVLLMRGSKVSQWVKRKFPRFEKAADVYDQASKIRAPIGPAILATTVGRVVQTIQYGLLLVAVGGVFSLRGAGISQGIHLVGAGLGDFIPNQVGATEGAYTLFASTLGLSDVASALTIALLARLSQIGLALVCSFFGFFFVKKTEIATPSL